MERRFAVKCGLYLFLVVAANRSELEADKEARRRVSFLVRFDEYALLF
jgi:hypothetical protein